MQEQVSANSFSSDRPISSRTEDLLGRTNFAESLARAIKSWKGKDSLVIALYGPWGSGKSSVKNLVLEKLKSSSSDCPSILEFNPWQLASQSQITEAFFNEVGTALGKVNVPASANHLAAKFQAYGKYLSTGRFALNGVRRFVIVILAVVSALGLIGVIFQPFLFLLLIALGTTVMAGALGWFSRLFESMAESFQAEAKSKMVTIPEMKSELADMLTSMPRSLLVVLDDVDRLSGDELKLLFQLLKGNADFPNIIYLILLSLDHAQKNLEPLGGKEYLEKIVQVGFEMPRLQRTQIDHLLGHEIERVMSAHGLLDLFIAEIDRWRSIYSLGAHEYFRTIRDVRRFASVLDFQLSHFSGGPLPEINLVDLTALQVFALFEPALYQGIYSAKERLVRTGGNSPVNRGPQRVQDDDEATLVNSLLSHSSENKREYARKMLVELFPRLPYDQLVGGSSRDTDRSLIQSLRICHAGFFDRYFLLSIPQNDLSEAELKAIIQSSGARAKFLSCLQSALGRGLFDVVFERLEAHVKEFDRSKIADVLTALFDFGDTMPEVETSFYIALPEERIAQFAVALIYREHDVSRQQESMMASIRAASGIYVPLLTYTQLFHASARPAPPDFDYQLKEAQAVCLEKIRGAAKSGALKSHRRMNHILRYWKGLGGSDSEVQEWIEELIQGQEGLVKLLRDMSAEVTSSDRGRFLRTNVEFAKNVIPLDVLAQQVGKFLNELIAEEDKVLLTAWSEAISYQTVESQSGSGGNVDFRWIGKQDFSIKATS